MMWKSWTRLVDNAAVGDVDKFLYESCVSNRTEGRCGQSMSCAFLWAHLLVHFPFFEAWFVFKG